MSSISTPRRRTLQQPPPALYTEDKDTPKLDTEQPNRVKGRALQQSSLPGPHAASDLHRPRTLGLARTGSIMRPQSSGIPTPRSSTQRKDAVLPPALPGLIGRSTSLRRPIANTGNQEAKSQIGGPPQRPAIPSSRLGSGPAVKAPSATPVGLDRSASSRIPGSGTPVSKQASDSPSLHSRAQSIDKVPATQSHESNLARPGVVDSTRIRPRSTTTGQVLTKGPASVPPARATQPAAPSSVQSTISGAKVASTAQPGASVARPSFTTLQQHFSPAKSTSKPPLPPSRLAPSSEEILAAASSSFETMKQQSELLYLSLLHQNAEPVWRDYERSAHAALQREYDSLQYDQRFTRQKEHSYQEMLNLSALAQWKYSINDGMKGAGLDFPEMVRCLSSFLHEVAVFSEPEGRYSTLIRDFTAWIGQADAILNGADGGPEHTFIDALPQQWHENHSSLSQRVRLLEREMGLLPPFPDSPDTRLSESALASTLQVLRSIVLGMKHELELLLKLERQVLLEETQRVEDAIVKVYSEPFEDGPAQPAAWCQ